MHKTIQSIQSERQPITSERQRTLSVAVVAAALMLEIIDISIVNVAIPLIQSSLLASATQIEWITAGYTFFFAVFLLAGGRLGDIFGYRRMFMIGLSGFGLASAGCGIATDADTLIVMRMLQGLSGAMMGPQVLAIVQVLYLPHERFKVMGIFGLLGGAAGILGPILGGTLIQLDLFGLSWRPIFLINVPVVAIALVLAANVLPAQKKNQSVQLDFVGTFLSIIGFGAFLIALIEGPALGWPLWTLAMPALSVLLIVLLALHLKCREKADQSPLVPMSLFKDSAFVTGIAISLIYQLVTAALLLATSLVLQSGLQLSPLETSLLHIPFALGAAISIGLISRRLLPRLGRAIVPGGVAIQVSGLLLMAQAVSMGAGAWPLVILSIGFALCGCGMGFISAPLPAFALARVPVLHAGVASGVFRAGQQFGAALGIATLGGFYLARIAFSTDPQVHTDTFMRLVFMQIALMLLIAALSRFLPADAHRKT